MSMLYNSKEYKEYQFRKFKLSMKVCFVFGIIAFILNTFKVLSVVVSDNQLEIVKVAAQEKFKIEQQSFDEIKANKINYKTPHYVGDKYKVSVHIDKEGYKTEEGYCKANIVSKEKPNCFIYANYTVYDENNNIVLITNNQSLFPSQTHSSLWGPILDIILETRNKELETFIYQLIK